MWTHRLVGPGRLEAREAPAPAEADLTPGELLLRFRAGGICGSDLPKFSGRAGLAPDPPNGFPLHELVGEVVASRAPAVGVGQRMVGVPRVFDALSQYVVTRSTEVVAVPAHLSDAEAVVIQPLATVLSALSGVSGIAGARVAVIGQGPLGLLLSHALKTLGAREVTGIDRVDRGAVASGFRVDRTVTASGEAWAAGLRDDERPSLVIEAVGHQEDTLRSAVDAVAPGGHIVAFGVPDAETYAFPFERFFRKRLTLTGGTTQDWTRFLLEAIDYLARSPELPTRLITHRVAVTRAQAAFELACVPAPGTLKVVLVPESA